ncbi:MAG: hypothetical protein KatS3mg124_1286 [Porticoccaceae bacterium]|nr:MAG: hypothetical protein KatS3mg124_1286 [Porticoccaceae bacterium]
MAPTPPPAVRAAETRLTPPTTGSEGHLPRSTADSPTECLELLALDFRSQIFQALARVPSYARWLLEADLSSTYAYHRRVLKLLQWRQTPLAWRLKSPFHLLFLPELVAVYPQVRFVMTHRDPREVLASVCHLYADLLARTSTRVDRRYVGEINLLHWAEGARRALAFRRQGGEERCFDISFAAFQEDPIGQVRRLYQWLGEPLDDAFVAAMEQWWEARGRTRPANAHPSLAEFGLQPKQVEAAFAPWRARFCPPAH